VRLGFNCYVVPTLAFMDGCYEPVEIILRFVTEYQFNIYKRKEACVYECYEIDM